MKHTAARTRRAVLQATTTPHTGFRTVSRWPGRGRQGAQARVNRAVLRLTTRVQEGLEEAARRPDRGDISTTTVIIWVAAVTGAVLIAGTIAIVIAKYNGELNGL
ncbi:MULTISPECIES: hypothetical protein [Streptomyces]|uniref:Integral membrane protein n=1 Tax=Streptomyces doebereineriae TaxID=3075528 RepID=A0ABU2VFZ1_9ACTN|nr:hypothetical protein [Streptomyces sp. DSM 41640]MDT0484500.1 hypothetical protein [Streptomyces sp. DSM 41640]